jgi:HlyD family secretion protein
MKPISFQIRRRSKLGLLLLLLSVCGLAQATGTTNVEIQVVTPQKLQVHKSYIGHLKPAQRLTVLSEAAGTVEGIHFQEGQRIQQGQVLVLISTAELELRVKMAECGYQRALSDYETERRLFESTRKEGAVAEHVDTIRLRLAHDVAAANLAHAQSEYNTQKRLFDKGLAPAQSFEVYKKSLEIARIQLELAGLDVENSRIRDLTRLENVANSLKIRETELALARLELEKSIVRAPFDGIVKERIVQPGGFIQKGAPLLELMDIDRVLVHISIPEKEMAFAALGKTVNVRLDAYPGREYTGTIKTLGLEADLRSRSFPAEVLIDNSGHELLPGMMARTEMLALTENRQVVVPRHAVLERQIGSIIFVEKDGIAVQKRVRTGVMVQDRVQILSGLAFGENLIIVGQDLLADKATVKVVNPQNKIASR